MVVNLNKKKRKEQDKNLKEYDKITKDIGKPITIEYTDGTEKDLSKKIILN